MKIMSVQIRESVLTALETCVPFEHKYIRQRHPRGQQLIPVGWKNYEHESTRNPFTYPDGDLFRFRSDQLKKKKEEKQLVKNQKVHEKTTFASRAASRSVSVRKTISDADETVEHDEESFEKSLKSDPSWILSIAKRCSCDSKSVKDYITKKREMFLAQYTVAVKQEAIRTMEATALEEEKHINDSEKKLEEDTLAFEEFLKENDRNSIEALKMAEQETRIKLDKNAEIRHATGEMMSITSDIARNEEILKEFLMYEEFLRKLSPPDWQEQQYNKKIAHKAKKKEKEKKNRESVMFPALVKRSDSKSTRILSKADSVKELKSHTRQKSLPESKRSSTRKGKTDTLKEHREKLHMACIEQEEKAAQLELRSRLFCFGEFNSQEQDKLLDMLNQKISQVYQTCIGESETTISTINMLSSIERHIDELYEQLETVSRDILEAAQKTKKKERRLRLREEKLKMQLLHQEERLKRALARATADPKKQTGRRLMPRSAPPKTKEKTSEDDHTLRVQEEYRYFFTWQ
uniref:Coiled-coil domain-containing protein 38 isoform X4 n=1 Tax=Geotrypetes seraphini TaxID=260995 RepID=A0A6P8RPF3_GEOSA|nr:coiled-coil domain-containing protein 38 isoform X4 [Geotrypetes seraphini]